MAARAAAGGDVGVQAAEHVWRGGLLLLRSLLDELLNLWHPRLGAWARYNCHCSSVPLYCMIWAHYITPAFLTSDIMLHVVVVLQSVIPLLSDTDSHTTLSARVAWPPDNTAGERQESSHGRRAGSKKNLAKINTTGLGPE